jgi:hypothetical protein
MTRACVQTRRERIARAPVSSYQLISNYLRSRASRAILVLSFRYYYVLTNRFRDILYTCFLMYEHLSCFTP